MDLELQIEKVENQNKWRKEEFTRTTIENDLLIHVFQILSN